MTYTLESQKTFTKFSIEPANRTEQILFNKIRDFRDGWTKINEQQSEIRIGVETNCNGEISKHIVNHQNTGDEIIAFLKKYNIEKYSLVTVDTEYEYSNKLQIEDSEYNEIAKQILLKNNM